MNESTALQSLSPEAIQALRELVQNPDLRAEISLTPHSGSEAEQSLTNPVAKRFSFSSDEVPRCTVGF